MILLTGSLINKDFHKPSIFTDYVYSVRIT